MSFVRNYYEGQNKIQPPKAKAVVVCHSLSENDENCALWGHSIAQGQ